MKNPIPGVEWMGTPLNRRNRKAYPSGGFKFQKSGGANAAEKRFGFKQGQLAPPKNKPKKRNVGLRPLGRGWR